MRIIRKEIFFLILILAVAPVSAFDLIKYTSGLALDAKLDRNRFPAVPAAGKNGMLFIQLKTVSGALVYVGTASDGSTIARILIEQGFNTIRECGMANEKSQKELKSKNSDIGYYALDDSDMYYRDPYLITFSCTKRDAKYFLIIDRWNEQTYSRK